MSKPTGPGYMKQVAEIKEKESAKRYAGKERPKDINRELTGLLWLCWHEPNNPVKYEEIWLCKHCGVNILNIPSMQNSDTQFTYINPDFTADPVSLLRLMMKRADWEKFLQLTGWMYFDKDTDAPIYYIKTDFITDTTGLLAQAAWDWLTAHRTEGGG
jgi:hypothetical protein